MIVVTGGAGFIGSAYIERLNREGIEDILVVDRLGEGEKWKNLVHKRFATMMDKQSFLLELEEGTFDDAIECIVHLGACSATTERDADYLFENNFLYSVGIAQYCLNNNIRLVYASSAATYGGGEHGYDDSVFDPLTPLNMYGYSKHLFDQWVRSNGYEQRICGLKFFNVFGPNEYHKGPMASMVFKSYEQIVSMGRVQLFRSTDAAFSDGGQMRDFIYVKDVCDVLWTMQNSPTINGIFNLGSGVARSWNELVHAVFHAMNRQVQIEYIDMPVELAQQYQNFTQAAMQKLQRTPAAFSCSSLEDTVSDYVQGYLQKRWRYV